MCIAVYRIIVNCFVIQSVFVEKEVLFCSALLLFPLDTAFWIQFIDPLFPLDTAFRSHFLSEYVHKLPVSLTH